MSAGDPASRLEREWLEPSTRALVGHLADPRLSSAPPALLAAAAAVRTLDETVPPVVVPTRTRAAVLACAVETVSAGGELPDGFGVDLAAAEDDERSAAAVMAGRVDVRAAVIERLPTVIRASVDALLSGPLTALYAEVQERWAALVVAADGRSFDDPASFVGAPASVQGAWTGLDRLVEDHAWLRRVQVDLLEAASVGGRGYERAVDRHAHEAQLCGAGMAWPADAREAFLILQQRLPWMPPSTASLIEVLNHGPNYRPDPPRPVVPMLVRTEPAPVVQRRREVPLVPPAEPFREFRSDSAARAATEPAPAAR